MTSLPPARVDGERARQIRSTLSSRRVRRDTHAIVVLCIDVILFAGFVGAAIGALSPILRLAAGCAAGFITLRLASIAHDAGHLSYTSSRALNKAIARIAFLPALQPFGTWEVAHNVIHHSWTSIQGRDYVWIPFSKADFDRLSPWRRVLERLYRSPLGHGAYYLWDLWFLRVVAPSFRWEEIRRRSQRLDILLVAAFALVWGLVAATTAHALSRNLPGAVFFGEVVPFLTWCELFGLTLYLQHTHPSAQFFRDRSEWEFCSSQVASATNVEFPRFFEWCLHGIFEHTAHHLDTSIPFYELHGAQCELNGLLSGMNVVYRWSWVEFLRCCRTCKLYDYDSHN